MFKMWERYLQHKAAMDILDLAHAIVREYAYRGTKENAKTHLREIDTFAIGIAATHKKIITELKKDTAQGVTAEEVTVLKKLFHKPD